MLGPSSAGATAVVPPGHEVYEEIEYRPTGSKVAFAWDAGSTTDRGEWRIYRGRGLDGLRLVDHAPARRGQIRYRYEARHPLDGREYFQLTYRDDDGGETVMATILLVGTEFTSALPPLPDGPPPALFSTSPGWVSPGLQPDADGLSAISPLGDRPKPLVPPPRAAA